MNAWKRRLSTAALLSSLLLFTYYTYHMDSDQLTPLTGNWEMRGVGGGRPVNHSNGLVGDGGAAEAYRSVKTGELPTHSKALNTNSEWGTSASRQPGEPNTSNKSGQFAVDWKEASKPVNAESIAVVTEQNTPRRNQGRVLLLSSVGRSGSSFLGQLFASMGDNIYFYEPIRAMPIPPANRTRETMTEELVRYFQCIVRDCMLNFRKIPSNNIIHPITLEKKRNVTVEEIMWHCRREPLIIIKTIRLRLRWIRDIMQRKEFDNLKVIHLARDPRGSYQSMRKLKWNATAQMICDVIHQDLQEKEAMMSLYPTRYTFIKYEDLCRDPYGQTSRLLSFIHDQEGDVAKPEKGNKIITTPFTTQTAYPSTTSPTRRLNPYPDIPKSVLRFLRDHTRVHLLSSTGPWSTVRNTSSMYQQWRLHITPSDLMESQASCKKVLYALGHRIFRTFPETRNLSIPLFED